MSRTRTSTWMVVGSLVLGACSGGDDVATDDPPVDDADRVDSDPVDGDEPAATTLPTNAVEIARPDVDLVGCGTLLDLDDTDIALGLLDLPMRDRSAFTFAKGEYCSFQWADDPSRSVRIEPGLPSDTEPGTVLLDVTGEPVDGVGDAAAWFSSGDEGLLAVGAATSLGQLNFRLVLSRPDIGPDERLAVAIEVANIALPRFPGIEAPPPPERDLAAGRDAIDRVGESWTELFDAGVDDGRWSRGAGLLELLESATGERSVPDIADRFDGFAQSGTGLVAIAREYVADPDDPDAAERLERLLRTTFPSRRRLARAVVVPPEAAPTTTEPGTVVSTTTPKAPSGFRRTADPSLPCDDPLPATNQCILTLNLPGLDEAYGEDKYLLFAPASNDDPDEFVGWPDPYVGWVVDAVRTSANWFEARGTMPTTSIVLIAGGNAPTMSDADPSLCTINVMTPIQSYGEGQFKQFIAGQMAHCFGAASFVGEGGTYDGSRWWTAGSAIWLSNEIYPDANLEWVHLPQQLTFHELQTSILDRGQTNGMWFQHLRWQYGTDQLITLLSTLTSNDSAGALAGWPEMGSGFHDFVQSLSDLGVPDSGNDQLAGFYEVPADLVEIDAPTSDFVDLSAFRMSRIEYRIRNGDVACVDAAATGGAHLSWREGGPGETGLWSDDLPTTISGTALFAGSSLADGGAIRITIDDVVDDPDDCDTDATDDGGDDDADAGDCQLDCGSSEYYSEP